MFFTMIHHTITTLILRITLVLCASDNISYLRSLTSKLKSYGNSNSSDNDLQNSTKVLELCAERSNAMRLATFGGHSGAPSSEYLSEAMKAAFSISAHDRRSYPDGCFAEEPYTGIADIIVDRPWYEVGVSLGRRLTQGLLMPTPNL